MAGDFDNSVSVSLSAKVNEKPFYAARVYEFISLLTQQFRDVTRKVRHLLLRVSFIGQPLNALEPLTITYAMNKKKDHASTAVTQGHSTTF